MQGTELNRQEIEDMLSNRKTVIHRPIKGIASHVVEFTERNVLSVGNKSISAFLFYAKDGECIHIRKPKYKVGETVFVQEEFIDLRGVIEGKFINIEYLADMKAQNFHRQTFNWQPASEMTEQQSRIKRNIIRIKIEKSKDGYDFAYELEVM